LYSRVGFIVTNLSRPSERAVKFYNGRGTVEQWIKEGKNALRWTHLSAGPSGTTQCRREPLIARRASVRPSISFDRFCA
jgi:hypothetical protein